MTQSSTSSPPPTTEDLTLDPQDWSPTRNIAHKALDQVLDFQMNVRRKPTWSPVPLESRKFLTGPAPKQGLGPETVVEQILEHVVPYPAGHAHPRFWGWVCGTGTPVGMVSDMLAAGINASAGTFNDAPSKVEAQLLGWMGELFGFPEGAAGIVTSGGSVANIIGLAVARDAVLGDEVRTRGLGSVEGIPTIYASTQVHSSVDKAMMLLGLGRDNLRRVPVDETYRMRVDLLDDMIQNDRSEGRVPISVVASAGTVNTGAIDDFSAISAITRREKIWFHVDGAIGALAVMSPEIAPLLEGLQLADSLAFDFHKWLYVPYEAGCVLIRDGEAHRKSFTASASYLEPPPRGVGANDDSSNIRGPQLSRGFKALKVWAQICTYGLDGLGRLQSQNVAHIRHFVQLLDNEPRLERLAPAPLNIACYRYLPENAPSEHWDAINQELLMRLQEEGIAVPSSTRLKGAFALRVANTNHRSRRADFELLVKESVRLGRLIEAETAW